MRFSPGNAGIASIAHYLGKLFKCGKECVIINVTLVWDYCDKKLNNNAEIF